MLSQHKNQFKISESLYNEIKDECEKFIKSRTDMQAVVIAYKEDKRYKDYRVALSFDLLRAIGSKNRTCFITKCYNNNMNDDHIQRTMLHMLAPLFENN